MTEEKVPATANILDNVVAFEEHIIEQDIAERTAFSFLS